MIRKIGALWAAFVLLVSVLAFPLGSAADSAAPDADYSRAFAEGYVDTAWQEEARDRQVLTGEFRGMLVSMKSMRDMMHDESGTVETIMIPQP